MTVCLCKALVGARYHDSFCLLDNLRSRVIYAGPCCGRFSLSREFPGDRGTRLSADQRSRINRASHAYARRAAGKHQILGQAVVSRIELSLFPLIPLTR